MRICDIKESTAYTIKSKLESISDGASLVAFRVTDGYSDDHLDSAIEETECIIANAQRVLEILKTTKGEK